MIFVNQPFTLKLSIPSDFSDLSSATSASIFFKKPLGETGEWTSGVSLDTNNELVTYQVPADTVDIVGTWRFQAKVTFNDGKTYPGETYSLTVKKYGT